MNDLIRNLEFNILNGEPLWSGVVQVGMEKVELHIEAPGSGPTDFQVQTLADFIGNNSAHRARICTAIAAFLKSRGLERYKVVPALVSISIVSISSPQKQTKLVIVGDAKHHSLSDGKLMFQAELIASNEYSISPIDEAETPKTDLEFTVQKDDWPISFSAFSRLYPVFLISGLAILFVCLLPSLIFTDLNRTFQKVTLGLGLIFVATGFLANAICGILYKRMQGKVGNYVSLKDSGRIVFAIDIMMFSGLGLGFLGLAYGLLSGAIPMNL